MKTIKITIEVEVEEEYKFVAVDRDGDIYKYSGRPFLSTGDHWKLNHYYDYCKKCDFSIVNFRETLTEVK